MCGELTGAVVSIVGDFAAQIGALCQLTLVVINVVAASAVGVDFGGFMALVVVIAETFGIKGVAGVDGFDAAA